MQHSVAREVNGDDDDPETIWSRQKSRALSCVAIVVGQFFGYLGLGRTYEVVRALKDGDPLPTAILALGIRPFSLTENGFVVLVQLVFLAWQIAAYRMRAVLLLLPGLLAALMMVAHILFNSYLGGPKECICAPPAPRVPFWGLLLSFVAIIALNSWVLGMLGTALLRPANQPWLRARLAAFAWTNGGLMLLIAQIWFLHWRFGSAAFV